MEQVVAKQGGVEGKTYPVLPSAKPKAIVLCCSDPRFQEAVTEFVEKDLGFAKGTYVPLTLFGAVASLTEQDNLPKEFKYLAEALELGIGHFSSIENVVLINHEDCAKYKAMHAKIGSSFLRRFVDMPERQKSDLTKVMNVVAELANRKLTIDRYFAKFANAEHTEVVFEKQ